jgi:PIN domain nuclease of toxin-antitoxin system
MIVAVADTHAIIWYLSADSRLSMTAKGFIDSAAAIGDEIAISSITLVEMVYLIEKGRIPAQRFTQLADELAHPESTFVEVPVDLKIARVLSRIDAGQVPDMPDRIVTATAMQFNVPVISRDGKIKLSSIRTIW